jgi:hypothetical protein
MPRAASDAAGEVGWGLCLGLLRLWGVWQADELVGSSSKKELAPVVAMLQRYGPLLAGLVVAAATDNQANAYSVNRLATAGDAGALMRLLAVLAMRAGVTPVTLWAPREVLASLDALSRCASLADAVALCRRPVVECRRVQDIGDGGWGFSHACGSGNGSLLDLPVALAGWADPQLEPQ